MKKVLLPLLAIILFAACQKQIIREKVSEEIEGIASKGPDGKIDVCHYDVVTSIWHIINISINAWPAHQAHGDVRLDDQDGDGFVPNNACGYGQMGDCDDINAVIHPGVAEIWNNGIDDNCNGQIDETSVIICNQEWMNRNLDVDHYRNGDPIPQVTDPAAWAALTTGAWCYYDNNPAMGAIYGKLYNWYAVNDSRGLAPQGWHVPTNTEWTILTDCLGGEGVAGGKMKEMGTSHWLNINTGNNSSGFSGLPGGARYAGPAHFGNLGIFGAWWSSTSSNYFGGFDRLLFGSTNAVLKDLYGLNYRCGISVRCIRD